MRLRLEDSKSESMVGRVLSADGTPLSRAQVHLRAQKRYPTGQVQGDDLVDFEGRYILLTDGEGKFRTPKQLSPKSEYAAFAATEGFQPDRTAWTAASSGTFPDLTLRRLDIARVLEGKARDRGGQAIAGAVVWSSENPSVRVLTDVEGRFRLEGLSRARGFLFVRKEGYRFLGRTIEADLTAVEVVLSRVDELPARRLRTLLSPLPYGEQVKQARVLLEPRIQPILEHRDQRMRFRLMKTLASIDPTTALEFLEKNVLADPDGSLATAVRSTAGIRLLRDDPEEASTVFQAIADPGEHSRSLLLAAESLPTADRAGKLQWVDRALLESRSCRQPADRVLALAAVSEHLLDLGETQRATQLLRANQGTARELPTEGWGGYARGSFAEELCQIDPGAAHGACQGGRPKVDLITRSPPGEYRSGTGQSRSGPGRAGGERTQTVVRPQSGLASNLSRDGSARPRPRPEDLEPCE